MQSKRLVELCFLVLFVVGVGAATMVHQSYDVWLSKLVQASGRKLLGGDLQLQDLRWLATEHQLSFVSAQWFDRLEAQEPWLELSANEWQFPPGSWQGAVFHSERLTLDGVVVRVRQEGLTTNINRLIKQLESVVIQPEKARKGQEALKFSLDECVLKSVRVEFQTVKHGVLRWSVAEIKLPRPVETHGLAFDVLLQRLTLELLRQIKLQTTAHLLELTEQPVSGLPNNAD